MKVKLEWLNELVDISDIEIDEIVRVLSLYSIEVESVEKVVSGTNLVVGHVLTKTSHPDSDHLNVCSVDVGDEVLQIVCGAPNVKADQYVIIAKIGAELPGGLKIKRSKIRGVESCGMICSLNELGMENKYVPEEYKNGIYYFKESVQVGSDALKNLLLDDYVVELGLTPNRGDLLSMLGVAIEVSAVFKRPLNKLSYDIIKPKDNSIQKDKINVLSQTEDCLTYYAQGFANVEIKASPWWLISRLIAFGIRPINNVVDITNYILALFGQPLHAFDMDLLGSTILVRKALENEKIITLDGVERNLETSDIVITDGLKPVAIAGVMGGMDTEITSNTKNIIIEAAVFHPKSIRQTSTRLGLRSDSSIRYEKGVDINRTKLALDYTAYLLTKYANAIVMDEAVIVGKQEVKSLEIKLSLEKVSKVLGLTISKEETTNILTRLGFGVSNDLVIKVPARRPDIRIEEDLIEEIGRIHGYDKLPITLPKSSLSGSLTSVQKLRNEIKNVLIGLGLNEIITYSLVSDKYNEQFVYNHEENSNAIELMMPLSSDRKYLRKSLVTSGLENVRYCYSRKIKNVATFEIGKVYYKKDNYQEEEMLSIIMANQYSNILWRGEQEKVDFYLIKGIVDSLFNKLGLHPEFKPIDKDIKELHPKRSASIYVNGENIGFVGCIHPQYMSENDLDEIYVCEIKLKSILNREVNVTKFEEISKVPSVERDIALVVNKDVLVGEIVKSIQETDKKTLSEVKVFDVYTGDKVNQDQKSVAIKLVFTANETLTDELVNNKIAKIMKVLTNKYNAVLRS